MENPVVEMASICQIALVVRDVQKTAAAYAELFGVEMPPVRETATFDQTNCVYRSAPTQGRAKLAFFRLGPITIELIEPIDAPSTWREFLETKGEGLHHVAFMTKGMDAALHRLEAKGMTTVQTGNYKGGRYAYVDASDQLKVILELLENAPKPAKA